MSNFGSWGQVSGGLQGTAPNVYVASTPDSLATITAAGYLDDRSARLKQNDILYINYDDTSTFPLGEVSTLGMFYVDIDGSNYNLVSALTALGEAAAKDVTDFSKSLVASVTGAFVIDNFVVANDIVGTIKDSGFGVNNILRYASVAVTAAEFNGMYAAPKLLIAAPGANKLIVVEKAFLEMTYVSAQYASGGVVGLQYDSTIHGAGVAASATVVAASFTGASASTSFSFQGALAAAPFSTTVNKGLYISNLTGAFTTGDSTFVCHIFYRILSTV